MKLTKKFPGYFVGVVTPSACLLVIRPLTISLFLLWMCGVCAFMCMYGSVAYRQMPEECPAISLLAVFP